jgi:hypothetical protein
VLQDEEISSDEDAARSIPRQPIQAIGSLGNTSAPKASSLQVEIRRSSPCKVYRVRGIPNNYKRQKTKETLNSILGLCNIDGSLKLGSLATSPYRPEKVATISFRETPLCLRRGDEWSFQLPDSGLPDLDDIDDYLPSPQIVIDSHFRDFTPLRTFESEFDHEIE